jgi:hypothetical protein
MVSILETILDETAASSVFFPQNLMLFLTYPEKVGQQKGLTWPK